MKNNKHRYDLNELLEYCMENDKIDLQKMEEQAGKLKLEPYEKSNRYMNGEKCDVIEGPCACGAWHTKGE